MLLTRRTISSSAYLFTVLFTLSGCGLQVGQPGGPTQPLSAEEVDGIIKGAAASLSSQTLVIAVTDREGNVLGLFRKPDAPQRTKARLAGRVIEVDTNELAISLARTGAFFSNDEAPLSSRTVRFISREHFPPTFDNSGRTVGVKNTPSGALWDIENTNRGCVLSDSFIPGQEIAPSKSLDRLSPGLGIATIPGGVPLFRGITAFSSQLIGGIGVCGVAPDLSESAAVAGSAGFAPVVAPPGEIFIDGVRLPFINTSSPFGSIPGDAEGEYVPIPSLTDPTMMIAGPQASSHPNVPEGWLVGPKASAELSEDQVRTIIQNAIFEANRARAAIRLPLQRRTRMVIAVTSLSGEVLGLFRMPDATVFSIDVAVSKARNVTYLSSFNRTTGDLPGLPIGVAVTNRTLRFCSQPFYPPGISDSFPGPFFALRNMNRDAPCTQGFDVTTSRQSGIVLFPGSAPLYRGGFFLVGGLGVSGDGVDQDDLVTAAGIRGFEAAPFLRADRYKIRGVQLPYLKFPREPFE